MRFYDALKREGVAAKLIGTPRSVSVGCGLSVQFSASAEGLAESLLSRGGYDTFLGAFRDC
jgi:hypothetical protein